MRKGGIVEKFSRRRAAAAASDGGLASQAGGRGSRRFRQAFHSRLAFAQQSGALPASSFDPLTGMRQFQPGLKVMPQRNPIGTFRVI